MQEKYNYQGVPHFFTPIFLDSFHFRDENLIIAEKKQILYSSQISVDDWQQKSILDMSLGMGEWSLFFAKQGGRLTFLNASPLVSKKFEENFSHFHIASRVQWIQSEFQKVFFPSLFDILFFQEGTFESFLEKEHKDLLLFLWNALKPGGFFIFEFLNRDYFLNEMPNRSYFEEFGRAVLEQMDFCYATSHLMIKRQFFTAGGQQEKEECYGLRLYSSHEIIALLKEAGFSCSTFLDGSSAGGPFLGRLSPQLLVIGRKEE